MSPSSSRFKLNTIDTLYSRSSIHSEPKTKHDSRQCVYLEIVFVILEVQTTGNTNDQQGRNFRVLFQIVYLFTPL